MPPKEPTSTLHLMELLPYGSLPMQGLQITISHDLLIIDGNIVVRALTESDVSGSDDSDDITPNHWI